MLRMRREGPDRRGEARAPRLDSNPRSATKRAALGNLLTCPVPRFPLLCHTANNCEDSTCSYT